VVRPRICSLPPAGKDALGKRAVELAAKAGLELDDWQAFVLEASLHQNGDRWAAFEVGVNVRARTGRAGSSRLVSWRSSSSSSRR
jgi:hypothetical protein